MHHSRPKWHDFSRMGVAQIKVHRRLSFLLLIIYLASRPLWFKINLACHDLQSDQGTYPKFIPGTLKFSCSALIPVFPTLLVLSQLSIYYSTCWNSLSLHGVRLIRFQNLNNCSRYLWTYTEHTHVRKLSVYCPRVFCVLI